MRIRNRSRWLHNGERRLWPLDGGREAFTYSQNPQTHTCSCGSLAIAFVRLDSDYQACGFLCAECAVKERRDWRNARLHRRRSCDRGESRACPVCADDFRPTRADSRYCSAACRQRAYRLRGVAGLVVAADSMGGAL